MPSGLYDADGKIRLTQSPGSGFCGRYAPDGSIYFTTAPGSGFCGSTAPDGSMYIVDATGSTTIGVYAPNGAIRVTTGNEYNGAWRVSGVSSVVASWDASTSTLALLAAITTHSRTSLATMFDSTGNLTYAPNNLLLQSNTFSNAAWTKSNGGAPAITWTQNQIDPSGNANSAWSMVPATTNSNYYIYQSGSTSGNQQISVVAKANGYNFVWLFNGMGSNASAWFNVSTGAVGTVSGSAANKSASIVSLGNGFYRCTLFSSVAGAWSGFGISNADNESVFTPNGTSGVIAYAATLSAVTYETTPRAQDQVITTSSAYYGPRIDYDPNTLAVKGLLIEEARTNLLVNSKSDGTNLATQNVTVTAQPYTLTFYGTGSVTLSGASTSGPLSGSGAFPTRSTLTFTPSAGTLTLTVAGTVQYAQLEAGSFATSYIPTGASSVTRAADVVQFTGAALTAASGSAATLISEWDAINASPVVSAPTQFGTTGGYPLLRINNATTLLAMSTAGNSASLTVASGTWNANFRVGLAYNSSGFTLAANGASASSAAAFTSPSTVYVGNLNGVENYSGNHHLRSFAIYNQRLPDGTLQSKSVVGASY